MLGVPEVSTFIGLGYTKIDKKKFFLIVYTFLNVFLAKIAANDNFVLSTYLIVFHFSLGRRSLYVPLDYCKLNLKICLKFYKLAC